MNPSTDLYTDDKHLVKNVLSGDNRSFTIIVKHTEKLVWNIVYRLINHREDQKDMMQDIYMKVYKRLPEFNFQCKLSTWIAQISYNTCIDYLRKKKLLLMEELPDEDVIFDDAVVQKDLAGILQTEMNKLPPLYKTLITLFHQENMCYAEIGQVTGLPEGTIKSYLFRARRALRNSLLTTYKSEDL